MVTPSDGRQINLDEPVELPPDLPVEHACEECGAPVYRKSNRGRWPKFCELHKKTPRTGGSPRRSQSSADSAEAVLDKQLQQLAADVARNISMLGLAIDATGFMPITSYVVLQGAEGFSKNAVDLAKRHPAVLRAMQAWSQVGPGVECTRYLLTILTAFAVDMNRLPPDSLAAQIFGVSKAWHITYDNPDQQQPVGSSTFAFSAPPPNPYVN